MVQLSIGQCGLCKHFGAPKHNHDDLTQIRKTKSAPAEFKEPCGHPQHAPLHLQVSAASGCDGFAPATTP